MSADDDVGPAARLRDFMLRHPVLAQALASPDGLEVRVREGREALGDRAPLIAAAATIDLDPAAFEPDAVARSLEAVAPRRCIVLHDVLQRVADYRGLLGRCFDRLSVGGHLIVTVPHQFLLERKWQPPSRIDPGHLRFYTPSTLLAEIEEAVDPSEFRVRLLADHDVGHDYAARIERPPAGGHEIVLAIEKIARPAWRDALGADETQTVDALEPTRYVPLDPTPPPRHRTIAPDRRAIARILVLKLDHRGDFLMAREAFGILRGAFPKADITLVCGPWNRAEAAASGLFDRVLAFEFFPEDASTQPTSFAPEERHPAFRALLGDAAYDLAVDLRLYDDTRALLDLTTARHRAGFDAFDAHPRLTIRLPVPIPTHDGRAERIAVPASRFETTTGAHRWADIAFPHRHRYKARQHLAWGPHLDLKPGHYRLELMLESPHGPFELLYDIVSSGGVHLIRQGTLAVPPIGRPPIGLSLYLPEAVHDFEWRLMAPRSRRLPAFSVLGMTATRAGVYLGAHQSEAMALLAHLVVLRLRDAFVVEDT